MRKAGATSRTSDLSRFKKNIALREASRKVFEAAYTRKTLRAMRFLAWALRRASVEKLAARILEKFCIANHTTGQRSVTIMYGDWGRRPNLKHQAPSPGAPLSSIKNTAFVVIGFCGFCCYLRLLRISLLLTAFIVIYGVRCYWRLSLLSTASTAFQRVPFPALANYDLIAVRIFTHITRSSHTFLFCARGAGGEAHAAGVGRLAFFFCRHT